MVFFQRKQITVDGIECVLDIIDTAGQDDFMAIRESYYKEGDGFLCVYGTHPSSSSHDTRHAGLTRSLCVCWRTQILPRARPSTMWRISTMPFSG